MSPAIGFARALTDHPDTLPAFPYAWLEAPMRACLVHVRDVPDWRQLQRWPEGRLFGPIGEYRWQYREQTLHAVLLLDTEPLPDPFASVVTLAIQRDTPLVLWGDWVNPQGAAEAQPDARPRFYANEIPGFLIYPLAWEGQPSADTTPRLLVRYYRDANDTQGEFVRCVDFCMIETAKGP